MHNIVFYFKSNYQEQKKISTGWVTSISIVVWFYYVDQTIIIGDDFTRKVKVISSCYLINIHGRI